MNRNEAKILLMATRSVYQSFQISDGLPDLWAEILSGVTYEEASAALKHYMRGDHEFAPTPGQLIAIAKSRRPRKAILPKWGELKRGDLRDNLLPDQVTKLLRLTGKVE